MRVAAGQGRLRLTPKFDIQWSLEAVVIAECSSLARNYLLSFVTSAGSGQRAGELCTGQLSGRLLWNPRWNPTDENGAAELPRYDP